MKTLALLLFLSPLAFGQAGLSITGGLPHPRLSDRSAGVYGLSYYLPSERVAGFHEFGLVAQPYGAVRAAAAGEHPKWESWGALVTGHLFLWTPWFRPGFHVGPLYGSTVQRVGNELRHEGQFGFYYGFNLQVLFLSFTLSNFSSGVGFNFTLGG